MGMGLSKIDDRRRAKIYKRVSFIEARNKFRQLHSDAQNQAIFKTFCVSLNFLVYFGEYPPDPFGTGKLCLRDCEGVEVDGENSPRRCELIFLLKRGIHCNDSKSTKSSSSSSNSECKDTNCTEIVISEHYLIGLNRQQHDALYL